MTRKHFKQLANAIKKSHQLALNTTEWELAHAYLVQKIETMCGAYNANFDLNKFRKACEPDQKAM